MMEFGEGRVSRFGAQPHFSQGKSVQRGFCGQAASWAVGGLDVS